MTVSPYLEAALQQSPRQVYWEGEERWTYGEILARAGRLRRIARDAGIEASQRVLVSSTSDAVMFTAVLAGLTGAFVPVIVDPDDSDAGTAQAAERTQVVAAILEPQRLAPPGVDAKRIWRTAAPSRGRLVDRLLGRKKSVETSNLGDLLAKGDEAPVLVPPPEAEAYVLCTSGSTSRPKCVAVSHKALRAHLITLTRQFGYGPKSRVLNPLPLHHTDGLIHASLTPFFAGACTLRSFRFEVSRTQEFVDGIYRGRATHVIAVPTIYSLVESLAEDYEATFAGDEAPMCITSAGPLDPGLEARWLERSGRPLVNVYGLTESVVGGTYNGPAIEDYRPGSVGRAIDCELSVRNEAGEEVGPHQRGELWLRGDNLATRYLDDEELHARTHVDGWFRTSDLVHLDEDGFCFIDGRCDNLIVCGGENVSPQEIESLLRDVEGVRQAIVYAGEDAHFGQVPHAIVELDPGAELEALRPAIAEAIKGNRMPRSFQAVPEIPMGPAGKVRRKEALAMYPPEAAGSEAPQHSNNVLEVAVEVFGQSVDSLNLHDGPDDIAGWDSLAHMRLVAKVEQRCRVRLSTAQIISIRTLRDLQEIVDQGASSA